METINQALQQQQQLAQRQIELNQAAEEAAQQAKAAQLAAEEAALKAQEAAQQQVANEDNQSIDEADVIALAQNVRWIMDIFIRQGFIQREAFEAALKILL